MACITSVGAEMAGRASRTSTSMAMREMATACPGLAEDCSWRAQPSRTSGLAATLGARYSMLDPAPHDSECRSVAVSRSSRGKPRGKSSSSTSLAQVLARTRAVTRSG